AAILLEQGQYKWSVLGIHRAPDTMPYQQSDLDILQRLGKHIRRALQIHRQFAVVQSEHQELGILLNGLKIGIVILDQDRRLTFANYKAQSILEKSKLLTLDRFNRLKTTNHFQTQLDQQILTALFPTQLQGDVVQDVGGVLALSESELHTKLMLSIVPFSRLKHFNVEQRTIHSECAAIFITEPEQQHQLATAYLKQNYQLSNREIELCEYFVNGLDLQMIAEQCNLTLSSVRTYFKNLYVKTECRTQTELMRFLLAFTINFEHIA
ncbi:hypothetical protein GWI33_011461, partial [Rhynchophorus ferrugineus]